MTINEEPDHQTGVGPQPQTATRPEVDLSFEVVLLAVLAVYTLLFGGWLFPIITGQVAYNRDSAYGVFLLVIALQAITMGKTPFGDLRRTWAVVVGGITFAAVGVLACFIPGVFSELARLLVGVVLTGGSLTLALRMLTSGRRREWTQYRGLPLQVSVNALITYLLLFPLGLITLWPGRVDDRVTAVLLLASGICLGLLAIGVNRVRRLYGTPAQSGAATRGDVRWWLRESSLSPTLVTLVLTGVVLVLLAIMLVPVALGLLPFSPDGQLGALMVIMAVQIIALGDTPVGHYRRSWLLVCLGILWAVLGITSSIVPGVLTVWLQMILGLGNLLGGLLGLGRLFASMRAGDAASGPIPPLLKRLGVIMLVMNVLSILFGLSMLLPSLIPLMVIPVVLLLNGVAIIVLANLQIKLAQAAAP